MELGSFLIPALYVAALTWAIGGDFLRAQLVKDLEADPPAIIRRAWRTVSLPTLFLVAALLLRLLVHVRGLLAITLFFAMSLLMWKTSRQPAPAAHRQPIN